MPLTFLLTGANLGDRKNSMTRALKSIGDLGRIVAVSSLYETAAWGKEDQPAFLNQAIAVDTSLPPDELMARILAIEKEMGRRRDEKYGARTIDIDILFYGDEIFSSDLVTIPHPQIQNRRFVLAPLAEIAAELVHPSLGQTIAYLLEHCRDTLAVRKVDGGMRD